MRRWLCESTRLTSLPFAPIPHAFEPSDWQKKRRTDALRDPFWTQFTRQRSVTCNGFDQPK